jgi:hypothetical protein
LVLFFYQKREAMTRTTTLMYGRPNLRRGFQALRFVGSHDADRLSESEMRPREAVWITS